MRPEEQMHTVCLSKTIEYTTLRTNPKVNVGMGPVLRVGQHGGIRCTNYSGVRQWWGSGDHACVGQRYKGNLCPIQSGIPIKLLKQTKQPLECRGRKRSKRGKGCSKAENRDEKMEPTLESASTSRLNSANEVCVVTAQTAGCMYQYS